MQLLRHRSIMSTRGNDPAQPPIIFTPSTEPYLGRPRLKAFDDVISAALGVNQHVVDKVRQRPLTELQAALIQLTPRALSVCLAIRELIRRGYLYGAMVLLRPLSERTVTALFLKEFPEYIPKWTAGWSYRDRPGFAKMIRELWGDEFPNADRAISETLNGLVHGDPESTKWNLVVGEDGEPAHSVSKNLNRPDVCDHAALEAPDVSAF